MRAREDGKMTYDASAIGFSGYSLLGPAARAITSDDRQAAGRRVARIDPSAAVRSARQMNRAAGVIAAAVLADSAVEHYRGSFHNKAMVAPIVISLLSLAVSAHGNADRRPAAHRVRDTIYAAAALTGLVGTGFHLYNITKKPGGFSWNNLFYQAPIGAPAALIFAGATGFLAERVRDTKPGLAPKIGGVSAGRAVAAATSLGLLGTVAEAGLLHFRGAFHDPFMYLPDDRAPRGSDDRQLRLRTQPAEGGCAVLAALDGSAGFRRRWLPRLRCRAQHGRLAKLVPECAERAADPGTSQLHRTGAGWPCRAAPDGGPSR